MKKRRIVIASILKPVDDTRMFEKMGASLASSEYEVFIIGYPSTDKPAHPDVHFLPLPIFSRLSFGRLLAPLKVLQLIRQVSPELLMVNTHELLIVAAINRIFFGVKIIYDIRENYYRNIIDTNAFPPVIKHFLAACVRVKERLLVPVFSWILVAERGYLKEMDFLKSTTTVIENKCRLPQEFARNPSPGKTRLLFSGTLAESTGVLQAIGLAKALHALNPDVQLTVIGFCSTAGTLRRVKQEIQNQEFITLIGGDLLVAHHQIMNAIACADFGIICYPSSKHTENSIPTKLYEYLACRLPILIQERNPGIELCHSCGACIEFDVTSPQAAGILEQMKWSAFYTETPQNVTWGPESVKLLEVMRNII